MKRVGIWTLRYKRYLKNLRISIYVENLDFPKIKMHHLILTNIFTNLNFFYITRLQGCEFEFRLWITYRFMKQRIALQAM